MKVLMYINLNFCIILISGFCWCWCFFTQAADINTAGKMMWEMAGASSDPGGYYYIAATMAAAGGTEGDMSFCIHYVVN